MAKYKGATGAKSLTKGTYEKKNSKIVKRGKKYMPEGKALEKDAEDVARVMGTIIQTVFGFKKGGEKYKEGE